MPGDRKPILTGPSFCSLTRVSVRYVTARLEAPYGPIPARTCPVEPKPSMFQTQPPPWAVIPAIATALPLAAPYRLVATTWATVSSVTSWKDRGGAVPQRLDRGPRRHVGGGPGHPAGRDRLVLGQRGIDALGRATAHDDAA